MMWIQITNSTDNRVADNTIAEVVSQTSDYYTVKHWHFLKEVFKVRKIDTAVFTPLTSATYKGIAVKVIRYLEDYSTGPSSFAPMTGKRILIEDSSGNQLAVLVSSLD